MDAFSKKKETKVKESIDSFSMMKRFFFCNQSILESN